MELFKEIPIQDNLILIFFSILVGLLIGVEREYHNKSAGLRTFILVSFGSCVFTILSTELLGNSDDRIAANIITGIGFIGAGVIFKGGNKIDGITTATTIWSTASLGMCIGFGQILLGILGTVLVLLILNSLFFLQDFIDKINKIREYQIHLNSVEDLARCEKMFQQHRLKSDVLEENKTEEIYTVLFRLRGKANNHESLIEDLRKDAQIIGFQY